MDGARLMEKVKGIRLTQRELVAINNAIYKEYERLENLLSYHERQRASAFIDVYQNEVNEIYNLHCKLEEVMKG